MDVSTIVNIILCVLSFILAAISVVTVVITLRQNNKMIEESTRPFISVYTDEINAGNPFFYLVIKNFGKSTAYITKFEYDFDFNGCYKIRNDRDYLQQLNNAVLAPGQSRICTLDYQRIDRAVTFTLEYHCAPLVDMLVKTAHNIRYITNFRIRFFILFRLMSRRFIPFVVKLWSNDPDK